MYFTKRDAMKFICYAVFISSLIYLNSFTLEKQIEDVYLPAEIQNQLVREIINTSTTRSEALQTLKNYALTNKFNLQLIKESKQFINQLLNQQFDLPLKVLAQGNYDDPIVKQKTLCVLQNFKPPQMHSVKKSKTNLFNAIQTQIPSSLGLFDIRNIIYMGTIKDKNYNLTAVGLGSLNYFISKLKSQEDDFYDINTFLDRFSGTIKVFIDSFKKNVYLTPEQSEILDLMMKTGIKIFGKDFSNKMPELLEQARITGNQEIIDYLKMISYMENIAQD
jgi:hypothetical protein